MITQVDIQSSQKVNSPKNLVGAHQARAKADTANKKNNFAIFDHLNLQKSFAEIDEIRFPRDGMLVNDEQNDYIEQYKDLKLFFKENIGEELKTPFISYTDTKTKYPIEVIVLRHQHEQIAPKKLQLFNEYGVDSEKGRFF